MKAKSHPRNWEAVAKRRMCLAAQERAKRKIAEAERDQLRAQMQRLHERMKRIQGGLDKAAVSILETLYNAKA